MKRYRSVRRGRSAPASPGVSLFPFLAVLLCTMGALVLLLVIVARGARLQAEREAEAVAAEAGSQANQQDEDDEDLEAARELVLYRIEKLQESRDLAEDKLAEMRLRLGHLEDHARRLRDQLTHLEVALAELDRDGPESGRDQAFLETELARITAELAEAERRLAEARGQSARRKRSYAVVPYQGPNETFRRPIYLECRSDSVVLMPEGVELRGDDFEGAMGPGNPLAAMLRAVREYLLARGGLDPEQQGEPYPLLLVRPGGIAAYYAARMAMKSWGSDFGYELVGEDWELSYPPADPELARVAEEALRRARALQERLAAAAPRHYSSGGRRALSYRAAPTRGGVVPDGGVVGGGLAPPAGEPGSSPAGGFGHDAPSDAGSPAAGSATPGGATGGPAGARQAGLPGDAAEGGRPSTPLPPGFGPEKDAGRDGAPPRPGEWNPAKASPDGRDGESGKTEVQSLADARGHEWALRNAGRGSMPVARSIRVDCFADRLVVVPESGYGKPKTVPLPRRTAESVDELVSSVWEVIDRWDIAGRGMYWRPVLSFHVAPAAEQRFRELQVLLDGSGLDVERE